MGWVWFGSVAIEPVCEYVRGVHLPLSRVSYKAHAQEKKKGGYGSSIPRHPITPDPARGARIQLLGYTFEKKLSAEGRSKASLQWFRTSFSYFSRTPAAAGGNCTLPPGSTPISAATTCIRQLLRTGMKACQCVPRA